jgi:hypothetical protein
LNRFNRFRRSSLVLGVAFIAAMMTGCGTDPVENVSDGEQSLDALIIIPSPLSPRPNALTQLTVLAQGEGNWAEYDWYVEEGTLLSEQGISVGWQAPGVTGTYEVRAIASLGALADTVQKTIMVRNYEQVPAGIDVLLQPIMHGNYLYFTGCSLERLASAPFLGFNIYRMEYTAADTSWQNLQNLTNVCPYGANSCPGGVYFSYHPAVNMILGSTITPSNLAPNQYPQNIVLWDMAGVALPIPITSDFPESYVYRASRNTHPEGNGDLSMIVWVYQEAGELASGTEDLYNIEFMNRNLAETMLLTQSKDWQQEKFYANIKPMITPQEDYIVYFVDSTGVFEPCLIEISGGLPDTTTREALMVEGENYGIFEQADISISENTIFQWRPGAWGVEDIVAFIDEDGYLCFFYPYSGMAEKLDDENIGKVTEFAWAPDGDQFAVVTEWGVVVGMTASGSVHTVFASEKYTDLIIGIAWSPQMSDPKIAFRLVRQGKTSIESFSTLVIYSLDEDDWYFALDRESWLREFEVGYDLKRLYYGSDNDGVYFSTPTGNGRSALYYSFR